MKIVGTVFIPKNIIHILVTFLTFNRNKFTNVLRYCIFIPKTRSIICFPANLVHAIKSFFNIARHVIGTIFVPKTRLFSFQIKTNRFTIDYCNNAYRYCIFIPKTSFDIQNV